MLCRNANLDSDLLLECSGACLEASEKLCLVFKFLSFCISRKLIEASCSISCFECEKSRSLGFKPRFAPHFSVRSYVWVGFASKFEISSHIDFAFSRWERAFRLLLFESFSSINSLPVFPCAHLVLGRLRLQVLTFKSQRLGFFSKASHFSRSSFRLGFMAQRFFRILRCCFESLLRKIRCSRLYEQLVEIQCFAKSVLLEEVESLHLLHDQRKSI